MIVAHSSQKINTEPLLRQRPKMKSHTTNSHDAYARHQVEGHMVEVVWTAESKTKLR